MTRNKKIARTHTQTKARPDEKMGNVKDRKYRMWTLPYSSVIKTTYKKATARKRRQRDKVESWEQT